MSMVGIAGRIVVSLIIGFVVNHIMQGWYSEKRKADLEKEKERFKNLSLEEQQKELVQQPFDPEDVLEKAGAHRRYGFWGGTATAAVVFVLSMIVL